MIDRILKATTNALDADEAKVAAHVLNTDMLAMQKLGGRGVYTGDDVQRLNRIMNEYDQLASDQKPSSFQASGSSRKEIA